MRTIRRVAVLGAGTMGSRIAAHFANAGVPSVLLDLYRGCRGEGHRDCHQTAARRVFSRFVRCPDHARQLRRRPRQSCRLRLDHRSGHGESGNQARRCGGRWKRCASRARSCPPTPAAFRCSRSREGFSHEFRKHFLGTHFFNPPRYLHLMEVIPGAGHRSRGARVRSDFADRRLGKGVVPCKDTPNFIANRIGSFFGGNDRRRSRCEGDYTIEEVDALTGPLIGLAE